MFAVATNALYTTIRRRGTTRQLAGVIVVCVISALLLLPAIVWLNVRFALLQAELSFVEVEIVLAYIAFCGWLLPLGATSAYCLFTSPRNSLTGVRIPSPLSLGHTEKPGHAVAQQPGTPAPYVYGDDTPWGWLEYRSGNFQGQRLALKRAVISIGRDEDNDIWLDDEMASRHHAELTWEQGNVYLVDCESLNGMLVNGQHVQKSAPVATNDLLEVGSQRFIFILAEEPLKISDEENDPLLYHRWRSSQDSLTAGSDILPATRPLVDRSEEIESLESAVPSISSLITRKERSSENLKETEEVDKASPLLLSNNLAGALVICDGEREGQSFLLNRLVVTVGRGIESDVVINDGSISRRHIQFLRQGDGDYVQDLASRNGTKVNDEPLLTPRLLQPGDIIVMGNVRLEYTSIQSAQTTPLTLDITPPPLFTGPISGVGLSPLKLPSKQK